MGSGCRVQGGAGTEARVNFGFLPQDGVIFLVNSGAVALIPTVAADGAALVPVKAKPVQVVLDQVGIAARAAPGVQILDPEQAAPAFCAGGESSAQRTLPRCIRPLGEGAKRPQDCGIGNSVLSIGRSNSCPQSVTVWAAAPEFSRGFLGESMPLLNKSIIP